MLEGTDPEIRSRVERMLELESGDQLLDQSVEFLSGFTTKARLPGEQLGPYRIEAQIGAGGMGTVYRAVDTRLGRIVAIKVARERYSERFQQEARAISALNHPNICTLYDVGPNYLVMEFIEGSTLAAELKKGPLKPEVVARYGAQVAGALAEAHALGIVHRDLKPANVILTRHGVKVLDFGLAKVGAGTGITETGGIMGTPAYMAPEQVIDDHVGPPADLFALGLVLYELAQGKLPPPGVALAAGWTDGATAKGSPLSDQSRAARELGALILRLLEPAPERRPASAAEVRDRLDCIATGTISTRLGALRPALLILLTTLAIVATWWLAARNPKPDHVLRAARILGLASLDGDPSDPALSPDGRAVAFSWNGEKGGNFDIYVMPVGGEAPMRLTRDRGKDISPAWSPDGSQIAFLRLSSVTKGSLVKVPSRGGPELVLRDITLREDIYRAMRPLLTWTPDGSGIVYTSADEETGRAALYVADVHGPATRKVLSAAEGTIGTTSPAFTPDGKWMAYTEVYGPFESSLFVRAVSAGLRFPTDPIRISERFDLLIGSPVWSPTGQRLLFNQGAGIFEWSPGRGAEQIYVAQARLKGMSADWGPADRARVVTASAPLRELHAITLRPGGLAVAGDSKVFAASANNRGNPQFSPDGKTIVFVSDQTGASEIWVADSDARNPRQLTHMNSTMIGFPHWSADSTRIAFHSWSGNRPQIFTIGPDSRLRVSASEEAGGAKQITDAALGALAPSWSPDGKYIYFSRIAGATRMFRTPSQGGPLEDLFEASGGVVTPDGHRIVYFKEDHSGLFSRSLDGDPAANPEQKLVDDYKAPGDDLNVFADGVYYINWNGGARHRTIRFYSYALRKSIDIYVLPGLVAIPQDLAVSPDRRRLVYHQLSGDGALSLIEFQ